MFAAHRKLLRASSRAVVAAKETFLIDVGEDGAFLCEAEIRQLADGNSTLFAVAHTWLSATMASTHPRTVPATSTDDTLGACLLMPPPLRRAMGGGHFDVPKAAIEALT